VVLPSDEGFDSLAALFDRSELGIRAINRINVTRISDACGFGVPLYDFQAPRDQMMKAIRNIGEDKFAKHFAGMWTTSIDGVPGLTEEESMPFTRLVPDRG
jgi:hypothetical protein